MYDLLKEFIKPELLVLIPVLYIVGMSLKKTRMLNKWIPYILGIFGIILCGMWIIATNNLTTVQNIFMALFMSITQGILVASASVYVNQLIKQKRKKE